MLQLHTSIEFVPSPNEKDTTVWLPSTSGYFTVKSVLKVIRQYKLVWGKRFIPQFSFIFWMLCRRQLYTQDKIKKRGELTGSSECLLCCNAEESMDHLFFDCRVSSAAWQKIQVVCLVSRRSYP